MACIFIIICYNKGASIEVKFPIILSQSIQLCEIFCTKKEHCDLYKSQCPWQYIFSFLLKILQFHHQVYRSLLNNHLICSKNSSILAAFTATFVQRFKSSASNSFARTMISGGTSPNSLSIPSKLSMRPAANPAL